jgi:hypothetical protein
MGIAWYASFGPFITKSMHLTHYLQKDYPGVCLTATNKLLEYPHTRRFADVAELADAQASGACGGNPVEVRVLSSAVLIFMS